MFVPPNLVASISSSRPVFSMRFRRPFLCLSRSFFLTILERARHVWHFPASLSAGMDLPHREHGLSESAAMLRCIPHKTAGARFPSRLPLRDSAPSGDTKGGRASCATPFAWASCRFAFQRYTRMD